MTIPHPSHATPERRVAKTLAGALALMAVLLTTCALGAPTTAATATGATTTATTYHTALVAGVRIFYREAGPVGAPTIVLLHGDPSSSHEFRNLIPLLADRYHLIAPDYPGFGYSDAPSPARFAYTFDHLTTVIDGLLTHLGLTRYSLYVQDIGGPIGFRLATRHPERIQALIVQNANAYAEGLSAAWGPIKAFWARRDAATERTVAAFFRLPLLMAQYTQGARQPDLISPDAWTSDQAFLDRPGIVPIQLDLAYDYSSNLALYPAWQAYFRAHQPPTLIAWGRNDPFFTVVGARAYLRDLPRAELHLLDTGHFALEEDHGAIAALIHRFLAAHALPGKP